MADSFPKLPAPRWAIDRALVTQWPGSLPGEREKERERVERVGRENWEREQGERIEDQRF